MSAPDGATPCAHTEWKPVPDARSKYQCAQCGVFGYRAGVSGRPQADNGPQRGQIIPYAAKSSAPKGKVTARPHVTHPQRRGRS